MAAGGVCRLVSRRLDIVNGKTRSEPLRVFPLRRTRPAVPKLLGCVE
ncbi:MAG: hypothetical protein AVDCRST_MAG33-2157 [uncultured Thermomicrobiales bacterium]|uniref:Uncharacterized protein n=1 Tax=uncultured Thermomicrobiales bacterium TaxID=1645740 RepID=A0A6J4V4Y4_9BACT|nr:MAG: hypothetical protein AVDCRST_MAG33-2157 [uncultured Thermomicrobiales bacterium]